MTDRYDVAESPAGYELHSGALRYCVVDNRPDVLSRYSPIDRGRVLLVVADTPAALASETRFRQIAFCLHKEDAELIAAALNGATT